MRLLIVDDEPIIVNGLVALFRDADFPELEVYYAYSAQEALDWLNRTRVDLVLSDIQMPGLNGLDMQREIRARWPLCKVIFLTGYNDFEYARRAIRQGSEDYLLKTDGFEQIVETVSRTLERIREERAAVLSLEKANADYIAALPELQNAFLREVLDGSPAAKRHFREQFAKLRVQLDMGRPVLVLMGRIDHLQQSEHGSDNDLFLFACRNITEEMLEPMTVSISVPLEKNKAVWLIQPVAPADGEQGADWTHIARFVRGMLEPIQDTCRKLLRLSISFALAREPVAWKEADRKLAVLKSMLSFGLGADAGLLLAEGEEAGHRRTVPYIDRSRLRKTDLLETYLESGQTDACLELLDELLGLEDIPAAMLESYKMEVFHTLAAAYISYLNRSDMPTGADGSRLDLSRLARWDAYSSWEQVRGYFRELSELLCRNRADERTNREQRIAAQVKRFIEDNLSGDLTLVHLGDAVGLNPAYLSRLYKQTTGIGLSEEITRARIARAKELLRGGNQKIHEISREVGFTSEHYFYSFFKKAVRMTPQEYREAALEGGK